MKKKNRKENFERQPLKPATLPETPKRLLSTKKIIVGLLLALLGGGGVKILQKPDEIQHNEGEINAEKIYNSILNELQNREKKTDTLIEALEEGVLEDLKKISSESREIQQMIDGIKAILEANRENPERNFFTHATREFLKPSKNDVLEFIKIGQLMDCDQYVQALMGTERWYFPPPKLRCGTKRAGSINVNGSYDDVLGLLNIDTEKADLKSAAGKCLLIHELIHVYRNEQFYKSLTPEQKEKYQKTVDNLTRLKLGTGTFENEELEAFSVSLEIIDLILGGDLSKSLTSSDKKESREAMKKYSSGQTETVATSFLIPAALYFEKRDPNSLKNYLSMTPGYNNLIKREDLVEMSLEELTRRIRPE